MGSLLSSVLIGQAGSDVQKHLTTKQRARSRGKNPAELVIFNPRKRRRHQATHPKRTKRATGRRRNRTQIVEGQVPAGHKKQCRCPFCRRARGENPKPKKSRRQASGVPTSQRRKGRVTRGARPGRRNPEELERAVELYQTFHGKDPHEVVQAQRSAAMRVTYVAIGPLYGLGIYVPGAAIPSPDHWWEYAGAVRFGRSKSDRVMLASNAEGLQLYAIGGDQDFSSVIRGTPGVDVSKDLVDVGECAFVVYFARKSVDDFQSIEYMHTFHTPRPSLAYDQVKKEIFFVGGKYRVEAPGIIK
jgi:hypothetical protein